MNVGIIMIGLLLVAGSVFGLFIIAGSSQPVYTDTFGAVSTNQTNTTSSIITNTTAPLANSGMGIAFVIVLFLIAAAAITLMSKIFSNPYGRR
jgi:hypothetical protein